MRYSQRRSWTTRAREESGAKERRRHKINPKSEIRNPDKQCPKLGSQAAVFDLSVRDLLVWHVSVALIRCGAELEEGVLTLGRLCVMSQRGSQIEP